MTHHSPNTDQIKDNRTLLCKILSSGLGLMLFNLLFATLAMMAMYFPAGGWVVGLAFLALTLKASTRWASQGMKPVEIALTALIGQFPALIFTVLALKSWYQWGPLTSDYDFLVQMWHAPLIPLLSALPPLTLEGFSVAYLTIFSLSPLLILLMTAFGGRGQE